MMKSVMLFNRSRVLCRCLSNGGRKNPVIPALTEHSKTTASASGPQVIPAEVRQKNLLLASALFSFVAGVYYYSISKMRNKDELTTLLEKESK
jgi:hypothetical protein